MKIKLSIFIILFPLLLWNQTNNSQNILENSDSLQIQFDNNIIKKDSTKLYLSQLRKNIDSNIHSKKKMQKYETLPYLLLNENFHLKSPLELNMHFCKNDFTQIPFIDSDVNFLQNYTPFSRFQSNRHKISLYQQNYELPVASTEAFLGIGDIDMNYALISFKKGNIINLKNLNMKFDFFVQDGLWLSEKEKSKNSNLHLFYNFKFGELHFYYSSINQDISSYKLYSPLFVNESTQKISEKINNYSFKFDNKIVDIGWKWEKSSYKFTENNQKSSRFLKQLLFKKNLNFKNHSLNASFEYFFENQKHNIKSNSSDVILSSKKKSDFPIWNLTQKSDIFNFNFHNILIYEHSNNYYISLKIKRNLWRNIGIQSEYSLNKNKRNILMQMNDFLQNFQPEYFIKTEKYGAGFIISSNLASISLITGENKYLKYENDFLFENSKNQYFENMISVAFNYYNFRCELNKWTYFQKRELKIEPKWQNKIFIKLIYHLKYDNAVKLGIDHYYISDYAIKEKSVENYKYFSSNSYLNMYFGIKITNKFEIKVDLINVTNTDSLFDQNISKRHYNIGLNWIFIN